MTLPPALPWQTDPARLPVEIAAFVRTLAALPGAVGIALGGSRALGEADARSDWDLAVYYRGGIDVQALQAYGPVHPPGAWGRLMNGGAWLKIGSADVDVILRDLDAVEHWTSEAEQGRFELDMLLGYLAGLPTYSLAAELAAGQVLCGAVPRGGAMPEPLRAVATPRWRFSRDFSLEYARMHAARGNAAGAVGQAAKAAMEEAHARLCTRGVWSLNEKRLLAAAGLERVGALFNGGPGAAVSAGDWLDAVTAILVDAG